MSSVFVLTVVEKAPNEDYAKELEEYRKRYNAPLCEAPQRTYEARSLEVVLTAAEFDAVRIAVLEAMRQTKEER